MSRNVVVHLGDSSEATERHMSTSICLDSYRRHRRQDLFPR